MERPTRDEVRTALATLDARQERVVSGLFALFIRAPGNVRDREWVARQLTEVVVLAGDFDADSAADGIDAVQAYLRENAEKLVTAALLLFQRVGLDLRERASEGFTFEDALHTAIGYLPSTFGSTNGVDDAS